MFHRAGSGGGGRRRRGRGGGGASSSSDEDEDLMYGYRISSKRKRKYVHTEGSDDSSYADSSSDDGGVNIKDNDNDPQQQQEQDDDDDFVPLGLGMRKRRGRKSGGREQGRGSAPVFVQGSTMKLDEEDEDEDDTPATTIVQQEKTTEQQQPETDEATAAAATTNEKEADAEDDPEVMVQKQQLQKEREEANQRFLSLLNRGKGGGGGGGGRGRRRQQQGLDGEERKGTPRETAQQQEQQQQPDSSFDNAYPAGLGSRSVGGLGLGATNTADLPIQFGMGGGRQQQKQQRQSTMRNEFSNLGSWEKHTKGIGAKLLSKMGYKGSGGLGKEKKGMTKPVPVKVRPAQLGLGFGNFKEVTKTIKQQEEKEEAKDKRRKQQQQGQRMTGEDAKSGTALLPSVRELLQDESWRRGGSGGAKKGNAANKRTKRMVIPYTELLQKQKEQSYTVIDMRGPAAGEADTATMSETEDHKGSGDVMKATPLAEEVLHNVSLLLNTYESKVYSSSSFTSSTEQRLASIESDVASTKERINQSEERIKKLQELLKVFEEMEELSLQAREEIPVQKIQQSIRQLSSRFTSEERSALQFSEVIVPSLIGAFVESRLNQWHPLKDDLKHSERLIRFALSLGTSVASEEGDEDRNATTLSIIESLLTCNLLPRVKSSLDSLQWDPIRDCESAVFFYELFHGLVREVDSKMAKKEKGHASDEQVLPTIAEDATPRLLDVVQDTLIHGTIYPKLSTKITQWKPRLDDEYRLVDSLDHWVLPWIPHLDYHRALVPSIVSDCKRKIRSSISYLNKSISDDDIFVKTAVETLRPWRGVLKEKNLQEMVSSYVTPRLARSLSRIPAKDKADQPLQLGMLNLTLEMNSTGLLSDRECLSLIEGEALTCWAVAMQSKLSTSPNNAATLVTAYEDWKKRIFIHYSSKDDVPVRPFSHTRNLLAKDQVICCYFYAVLLMIRAASDSNMTALEDLQPSSDNNFRVVLARRTAEEKRRSADDLLRMESKLTGENADLLEARVRLSHRSDSNQIPTFREVVAEYAREREILFQPRMGSNSSKDGKQVFLFGKLPVYFDADVVFTFRDSEWQPVTLDELAKQA